MIFLSLIIISLDHKFCWVNSVKLLFQFIIFYYNTFLFFFKTASSFYSVWFLAHIFKLFFSLNIILVVRIIPLFSSQDTYDLNFRTWKYISLSENEDYLDIHNPITWVLKGSKGKKNGSRDAIQKGQSTVAGCRKVRKRPEIKKGSSFWNLGTTFSL